MSIRVYNTLSRKKEEFIPRDKGKISVYICGPTVYNYIHIGNARCYIAFDAIIRYLKFRGPEVFYARNITDVDDKIINRAREEGTEPADVAGKYTKAFEDDMKLLGVAPPDVSPKATEHIPEMLEMVETLIKKGYAYEANGDVFFDITKFGEYGKLSHRTLEEMRAGERIEPSPNKRNPLDFALWKKAKAGEISWSSPWGEGRPGWHLECSIMSLKYLNMGFDIHGGGQDLIFPHHENEIAQSEASTGEKPFVRYWLHNGFVNVDQEKMAKSLGNVVLVRDFFIDPDNEAISYIFAGALRILFLSTHYRSPIDFSIDKLNETIQAYNSLEDTVGYLKGLVAPPGESKEAEGKTEKKLEAKIRSAKGKFVTSMDDDFNTATALGLIFSLRNETEAFLKSAVFPLNVRSSKLLKESAETLTTLGGVLGLNLGQFELYKFLSWLPETAIEALLQLYTEFCGELTSEAERELLENRQGLKGVVDKILQKRDELRKGKDWQRADEIRTELKASALEVEDTASGPRLKFSFAQAINLFKQEIKTKT